MSLDHILKTIREKTEEEAQELIKQAEKERQAYIREAEEEARKIRKEYLKKSQRKAEEEKKREIIHIRAEEKKKILNLKKKILGETFDQAQEELGNLEKKEYLSLIKKALFLNLESDYQEIIVSVRDKAWMEEKFINEIKRELAEQGRKEELSLQTGLPREERGFILKKEGIEINCTFSDLFQNLRDDLEIEVAQILFSQGK